MDGAAFSRIAAAPPGGLSAAGRALLRAVLSAVLSVSRFRLLLAGALTGRLGAGTACLITAALLRHKMMPAVRILRVQLGKLPLLVGVTEIVFLADNGNHEDHTQNPKKNK